MTCVASWYSQMLLPASLSLIPSSLLRKVTGSNDSSWAARPCTVARSRTAVLAAQAVQAVQVDHCMHASLGIFLEARCFCTADPVAAAVQSMHTCCARLTCATVAPAAVVLPCPEAGSSSGLQWLLTGHSCPACCSDPAPSAGLSKHLSLPPAEPAGQGRGPPPTLPAGQNMHRHQARRSSRDTMWYITPQHEPNCNCHYVKTPVLLGSPAQLNLA